MKAAEEAALGYEAVVCLNDKSYRVQIQGRASFNNTHGGHRCGQFRMEQEWNAIILVIMDEDYEIRQNILCRKTVVTKGRR